MATLVKIKASEGADRHLLIEVSDDIQKVGAGNRIQEALDKTFDKLVVSEIVDNCSVLVQAFEQVNKLSLRPKKATAEFGLKFTAKGDIYVVNVSAEASYKVSLEWEL